MSSRKFAGDRIAKKMLPREDDENSYSSSSESESEDLSKNVDFNPSRIRKDAIPETGSYTGKKTTRAEMMEASDYESSDIEEEEEEEEDDNESIETDESDVPIPDDEEVQNLTKELEEVEQGESSLVSSLRKQQETDMNIAKGVQALQQQFTTLLGIRLKLQPLLTISNTLPPAALDNDEPGHPYAAFTQDPEVQELVKEVEESLEVLREDIKAMKQKLVSYYKWQDEEDLSSKMMDIIAHWGHKQRLTGGLKRGSVINRPIEQQISALLADRSTLIQPTRHRHVEVLGLDTQPEILSSIYNDTDWYDRLLHDFVAEKNPKAKVVVQKTKKDRQKNRQINYEVIPELQNFMTATMKPVPDYVDALFASLLK